MKAQLNLVGGRPIPNILTIIHEKPETVVAVCSEESFKDEWPQLKQAVRKLLPDIAIKETDAVDAFDVEAITEICEHELLEQPDTDWIINLTAGTSLMTLGAYIAAERCSRLKGMSVRCWYLNTSHSRVIALIGEKRASDIFFLDVDQYVAAYNYRLQDAGIYKSYRARYLQEDWLAFAERLGKHPQKVNPLKQILKDAKKIAKTAEIYDILQELEAIGLVHSVREEGAFLSASFSDEQRKFLDGAWLELYVYQEAKRLGFFDSIQWSREIIDNDPNRTAKFPLLFKEIDVALTYKAHLMIVECKTGDEGLDARTLDNMVTIADLIGRGFVIKVLVTSRSLPKNMDDKQLTAHEDFKTKARIKGVHVVMLEDIPLIGSILEEQTKIAMRTRR